MKKVNAVLTELTYGMYWEPSITPYTLTITLELDQGFGQYLTDKDKIQERIVDALNNAEINIHIYEK